MLGAIAEAGGELISCSIFCVEVDVLLLVFTAVLLLVFQYWEILLGIIKYHNIWFYSSNYRCAIIIYIL